MTIDEIYSIFLKHPAVTTDSRNCPPGSLFFALRGEHFDGHDFVEKALQSGCAYAIVDKTTLSPDKRVIVVENVLQTLQHLAKIHRKTCGLPVIGITGTNGKTTTKELIAAVLSQKFNVLYTSGNLNNQIGVPLTLLRLTKEHEIAVIEMGANHPGEIAELSAMVCPDYGLITNVGFAHLEGFGSLEGVVKAKGELYDYLRTTNGVVFIHRDNDRLTDIAVGLTMITYGVADSAGAWHEDKPDSHPHPAWREAPPVAGKITGLHPFLSFTWQCTLNKVYEVHTRLVGGYNFWNALAAIAIGSYFDVPVEKINEALASYQPTNNRSQLQETKFNKLIIDAYNANPSSMCVALENFATLPSASMVARSDDAQQSGGGIPASPSPIPKVAILGDMLELGEKSQELHAAIIRQIERCNFEKVLLCGRHFSAAGQRYTCFPTVEMLCAYLKDNQLRGYYILIKGSRAIHLEKIIEWL